MPALLVASLDLTAADSFAVGLRQFIVERSLVWTLAGGRGSAASPVLRLQQRWPHFLQWLSEPAVITLIVAWCVTFTVVLTIVLYLGFGPSGIVAGTAAAAFQSLMYGGMTPAGGLFATLTSMAMLGWLQPLATLIATVTATGITAIVWALRSSG